MRTYLPTVLVALFVLGVSIAQATQLYRWIDDQGTIHFTTDPGEIPEEFRDFKFEEPVGVATPKKLAEDEYFEITETKDISYAGFKRITVRVLINKDSTETSAREVAEYIVKKKKSEISELKGITIWGYYNPPGRGAWEAFHAEWQRNRGLYSFKFEEPFVVPIKLAEDEYAEIVGNQVNIRLSPATSSPIIAKGRKGDLFKLKGDEGKWYKISISSGEYRYVHKSLTKAVRYEISLPNSETTRLGIFKALLSAEDRAQAEADREYPITDRASLGKNVDYMRILDDRYKLNVMHEFGVQPPIYIKIVVEGVEKNW